VVPAGAPIPPECFVATKPAGAAPRPAFRALRDCAPQRTRRVQCNGDWKGGDDVCCLALLDCMLLGRGARCKKSGGRSAVEVVQHPDGDYDDENHCGE
jgi:hypothetical protein